MDSSNRTLWIAIVLVTAGVGALLLQPRVERIFLPEPVAARVGIEVEGSGIAVEGPVDLLVGQSFRLHAILEAEDRSGEKLWYSEAPRIRLAPRGATGLDESGPGASSGEVPADRIRRWQRRPELRVRWFTVEGLQPFVEVEADGDLSHFEVQPFVRPDWPLVWSIPGEIDAAHDDALRRAQAVDRQRFGTQRYLVQFELYAEENDLIPARRIRSSGPEELLAAPESFPTVRLRLPSPLGPASEVFGRTQIEVRGGEPVASLRQAIDDLVRRDLAFSRSTVLRDLIRDAGLQTAELTWTAVETGAGLLWGDGAAPGDLLRAGDRVVVLWQDRGVEGQLDDEDLCFDYVQGPTVRRIGDVFLSGEGQLELARLAR